MTVHSCVSLAALPLFLLLPVSDWLGIVLSLLAYSFFAITTFLQLLFLLFFVSLPSYSSYSSSFLRSVCLSLSLSLSLHLNRHRASACFCVRRRPEISFFYSCYCCCYCFYYCDKQRRESCSFCRVYATHATNIRMLIESVFSI